MMAPRAIIEHADEVMRTVDGMTAIGAGVEARIARSWARCARNYHLAPDRSRFPTVIEAPALRERMQRHEELIGVANDEMDVLYEQIAGSGYAVVLTDTSGIILSHKVDPTLGRQFRGAGLLPGADWSERSQGTNGVGTCLAELKPVIVHREEHFSSDHIGLSCSAALIRDPLDVVVAALDASCVGSTEARASQLHTMALVNMSAQVIEKSLFVQRFRDYHYRVLRFHWRPELVNLIHDGALALDRDGNIVAADRTAVTLLGKTRSELIGRPVEQIFTLHLGDLGILARRAQAAVWPIRDRANGHRYYVSLHQGAQPAIAARESRAVSGAARAIVRDAGARTLDQLAGDDPPLRQAVQIAQQLADSDAPVLLQGPTRCGKEVFARAMHRAGRRTTQPFVAVNCSAIAETLIEGELFGKLLETCRGTVFLEEIGDLPLMLQTRLLRVLKARELLPLGGEAPIAVHFRIISASRRILRELVTSGAFREDLYYCLSGVTLELPPPAQRATAQPIDAAAVPAADPKHALIMTAIERSHWNMTLAAKQLGISRNTLYRKIKQLGIPLPRARRS